MNKRADWMAWSLQFIDGFVVGAVLSLRISMRHSYSSQPNSHGLGWMFTVGAGLIGAALASHFGDQLWLGDSYRVIPPDEPQQDTTSTWASWTTGLIGGSLVLVAIFHLCN